MMWRSRRKAWAVRNLGRRSSDKGPRRLALESLESRHLLAAYYVDGDNPLAGDGSTSNPFRTIQQAVNAAAANAGADEVVVDPITTLPTASYASWVFINDLSGALTLRGAGASPSDVVIDARAEDWGLRVTLRNDVTISNLKVINAWNAGIQVDGAANLTLTNVISTQHRLEARGLATINTGDVTIEGGSFSSNPWKGIEIVNAGDVRLTNVVASSNGLTRAGDGVYIDRASDVTVEGGDFSSNKLDGVKILNAAGNVNATNVQAVGNSFAGLRVRSAVPVVISGGLFKQNAVHGVKLLGTQGATILGAEISDNGGSQYKVDSSPDSSFGSGGTGIHITNTRTEPIRIESVSVLRNAQSHVGAGIYLNSPATAEILSSRVENNNNQYGQSSGGGIYLANTASSTSIRNSNVSGNRTNIGGGIYARGALEVSGTTVEGNTTLDGGGGIYKDQGSLTVSQSTISGNSGGQTIGGGGVYLYGSTATIVNTTISGNTTTGDGAGVRANSSSSLVRFISSTITNNHAQFVTSGRTGGGIHVTSGTPQIVNTIVAKNTASAGPDILGTMSSQGYNLIGDGTRALGFTVGGADQVGTSTNPINPLLGSLAQNGGPTKTHALLQGSPAIDRGVPNPSATVPAYDQRGVLRPQGTRLDIGAFENNNSAPVAADDSAVTNEDASITVAVLANDFDPDADPMSITATGGPLHGEVTLNADGTITYQPNPNYHGSDSFIYTVSDTSGYSDTATVHILVNSVEDNPQAIDDEATTDEETPVTVAVLSNDLDADGDAISVSSIGGAQNGRVDWVGNAITYTPWSNFHGSDSFTYTITDTNGNSDEGVVRLTIRPINDLPDAVNDSATTSEDSPTTIAVLQNDSDNDGDSLSVSSVGAATNGTATLNADGTVTYVPNANYHGPDSFNYTITDGKGATDTAVVNVTVTSVDDAPLANDDSATTNEDTSVTISVLSNDSDGDGDRLTVTGATTASNGTVTRNVDGTITYTPTANFHGTDSFTYTISDGSSSDIAVIEVTVRSINDAPDAVDDTSTFDEETSVSLQLLSNDTDLDGNSLIVTYLSPASNGTVTWSADGTFNYSPAANFHGIETLSYIISDGSATETAFVRLTIRPVNDNPDAGDDAIVTNEDTAIAFDVLTNDTDVDGEKITVTSVAAATNGTVAWSPNGTMTYTPRSNFHGTDSFAYTISDGNGSVDTAVVTVTVRSVNDLPNAVNDSATTNEDYSVTIAVLGNDTDADGNTLIVSSVTDPANGTTTINANMTITYKPDLNFKGTESFQYTVSDGNGGSDTATVAVTVIPNRPPLISTLTSSHGDFDNPSSDGIVRIDGTYSDPDANLDTHTVTVNWGDGSVAQNVSVNQATDSFSGQHDYATAGEYTVSVFVTDSQSNRSTSQTVSAVVSGMVVKSRVLYVIGTTGADTVSIGLQGKGKLKVEAGSVPGGAAFLDASGVDTIVAHLGSGNDVLTIAGQVAMGAILDGGAGDDRITAGGGPAILIGGRGTDQLTGGNKDDILIGGTVNNTDAALLAVLATWKSSASYDSRVSSADAALSVLDDLAQDVLTGGGGRDLFFRSALDSCTDVKTKKDPETVLDV